VTTLVSVPLMMAAVAAPAAAATGLDPSQFHGVHWSRLGDNFTADPLVLQGLSASDDYNATRTKADAMFATFQSDLGANTVRLPINPVTAAGTSYYGVIDAAVARGLRELGARQGTTLFMTAWKANCSQVPRSRGSRTPRR